MTDDDQFLLWTKSFLKGTDSVNSHGSITVCRVNASLEIANTNTEISYKPESLLVTWLMQENTFFQARKEWTCALV